MSEADDVVDSISEAPMSGDEKDTALKAEWEQVCIENGVDPVTHCLPDGRRVNVGYLVLCKKLGHPHPSFEPTVVVPDEVLPAVDPGAFCKPRTPDKPKGTTRDFGQFPLPPGPDPLAFLTARTPTNVPESVLKIANECTSQHGPRRDLDKPHPIQLAREHKAASEPRPSGREETPTLAFKPKASRPGFRVSQPQEPRASQSPKPKREWEDFVRRITREEIGRMDGRCSPSDIRTRQLVQQEIGSKIQQEFQRLAEARALRDANDERDREVARELQRTEERLEAVRYQKRLFASMCFFVAFLVVMYVGWWLQ